MEIMDMLKKDMVENLVKAGKRLDERQFDEYRKITVEKGVLQATHGSALARIGKTQVLAAVKFDVSTPFSDRPDEGLLAVGAEFLPVASPEFEPGPPNEHAIELARVVDRGIRAAEVADLKSFFIEEGKVLGMFVDIYVLDHYGNLIDAASLAAMGALMNTRMPKLEDNKMVWGEYKEPLNPKGIVTTTTFNKIAGKILLDADRDEEKGAETRISISMMDNRLCAIQKSMSGSWTKPELDYIFETSTKKNKELKNLLEE